MKPNGLFIILGLILVGLCAQGAVPPSEHSSAMSLSDWVQNDLARHSSRNDVSLKAAFDPDTQMGDHVAKHSLPVNPLPSGNSLPNSLPVEKGTLPTKQTVAATHRPFTAGGSPDGRTLDTGACLNIRVAMVSHSPSGLSPEIGPGVNQTSKIPVSSHSILFLASQERNSSPIYLHTLTLII